MNTTDSQITPPPGDLAAEYVLGVLGARERIELQARMVVDAGFARDVARWESRFMPLLGEIEAVPVPDYVWQRIRSTLNLTTTRPATSARSGLWDSLNFWRWLASGAFATAVALAFVLFKVPQVDEAVPSAALVSTLTDDNGVPGFVAVVDRAKSSLTITPLAAAPTDGRAQELWLIPEGQAPVSLGLLDAQRAQIVKIPDDLLAKVASGALFAVTLEPREGAPHAAATGPIIAKGGLAIL